MTKLNWEHPEKLGFLFQPSRYKVAYGGRGGTKSWGFARALLIKGWKVPLRVLCAREIQNSIKDSVHKLLSDQVQNLGLGAHYEVRENVIRGSNGTEFLFTGLSKQTAESIKSFEGIDICWVEEAHKVLRRSWDILLPTIRKEVWRVYAAKGAFVAEYMKDEQQAAETRANKCGGKAVFEQSEIWISLNPELDTDETFVRFVENPPQNAVVVSTNWRDNPWLPAVLNDERKELLRQVELGVRSQDDYDNIWEGQCRAAVEGAIYSKEILAAKMAGRLGKVPYDPLLKVHCVWDLGWNDKMVIVMVQTVASSISVINYVEDSHRTYDSYVNQLKALDYNWGQDYLPHDARAKNAMTGMSPIELLKKLGRDVKEVPNIGVEQGINAARLIFPRVLFDREKAGQLFNALGRYRRAINQATQEPGAPLHDDNSHGADAFRYLSVVAHEMTNDGGTALRDKVLADMNRSFSKREFREPRVDIRNDGIDAPDNPYSGFGEGWAG